MIHVFNFLYLLHMSHLCGVHGWAVDIKKLLTGFAVDINIMLGFIYKTRMLTIHVNKTEHTTSLPLLNLKNIVDLKIHVSLTLIVRPKMALLEVSPRALFTLYNMATMCHRA